MPSLEDLGTRQIVSGTPASDDIVAFFDVSEFGNNPVKKTTVASLLAGAAGSTDSLTTSNGTATAAAGDLGEYLEAANAVQSLTNYIDTTIVSMSLSPGDWDVEGAIEISGNMASISLASMGLNTVNVVPTFPDGNGHVVGTSATDSKTLLPLRRRRFLLTATTTVRAVVNVSFSAGSVDVSAWISARRVR